MITRKYIHIFKQFPCLQSCVQLLTVRKYFLIWSGKRYNSTSIVLIWHTSGRNSKKDNAFAAPRIRNFPNQSRLVSIPDDHWRKLRAACKHQKRESNVSLKTAWKKSSFLVCLPETQRGVIQIVNRLTWIYCLGFNFEEPGEVCLTDKRAISISCFAQSKP